MAGDSSRWAPTARGQPQPEGLRAGLVVDLPARPLEADPPVERSPDEVSLEPLALIAAGTGTDRSRCHRVCTARASVRASSSTARAPRLRARF